MTSEEFVKQQIAAGYKVHFHDGIWWQRRAPFFYRPVNFLQKFNPGEVKPKISKSFLGYSHLVTDDQYANNYNPMAIMSNDMLNEFSLNNIEASKRKRIRKGLRLTTVRRIDNITDVIEDIKNICISMAKRTQHGLPPEYYVGKYDKWKSFMMREFSLPSREWWGVYYDNILVAYRYDVLIDNTMFFLATKSHTDYLHACPNDALMFTFIEYCKGLPDCKELNAGDWNPKSSINAFKELFGFRRVDLPVYKKQNTLVNTAKKCLAYFNSKIK
jgi:hypothetical protein